MAVDTHEPPGPARARMFPWLPALLMAEVIGLSAFRSPEERWYRFAFQDSGGELVREQMWRQGLRPAVDFGYLYGLLPVLVGHGWYGVFGLGPSAFRGLMLVCSLATAWGLARFAAASRLGPAGLALVALAVPDFLQVNAISLVHNLEMALLVLAMAEQARGRRSSALAVVTACVFVKPSMAYVYGLFLVVAIALSLRGLGRNAWVRAFAPAALTGLILAALLGSVFGPAPLVNTVFPVSGASAYRETGYGFFRGTGRAFWALPGGGVRDYFRYEVGFWLVGTLVLVWGGVSGLVRLSTRHAGTDPGDEVVACCATLHVAFVTLFFGDRGSWVYYFPILILGLAALSRRDRGHAAAAFVLAAMLLVNDRSKLNEIGREWSTLKATPVTMNLWATSRERAEWSRVLELTRGGDPVMLSDYEGAALFTPGFARPVCYFDPGRVQRKFLGRKVKQLADARVIVRVTPPDWRGLRFWPELIDALDGCEVVWRGELYTVYRRVRPPGRRGPAEGPDTGERGVP